jgi:CysZ protein
VREFGAGVATLLRGFGFWRRSPGRMALGLLPALLVGAAAAGGLIAWGIALPGVAESITPFADAWIPFWAGAVRVAVGVALFGAALLLIVVTFTALTLLIGEPFYDRIWRAVETDTTGSVPDTGYGFWRAVVDSIRLITRGVLAALVAGLIGLIPVIGGVAGFVVGALLTGWLLADELSSRALTARGLGRDARRQLLRGHRARALGFGVATQLCFLVPLGAVAVMPAAVAGSTLLAHDLLRDVSASAPPRSPAQR